MVRLLILSCSQRKRPTPGLLPALERYDGPAFRVVRRYLRGQTQNQLDIWILSAQFGLIPGSQPIPYYDLRMTPQRAYELQPQVVAHLVELFHRHSYRECFIAVGRDYLAALQGYDMLVPLEMTVVIGQGSQGRRLTQLHNWLHRKNPASLDSMPPGKV